RAKAAASRRRASTHWRVIDSDGARPGEPTRSDRPSSPHGLAPGRVCWCCAGRGAEPSGCRFPGELLDIERVTCAMKQGPIPGVNIAHKTGSMSCDTPNPEGVGFSELSPSYKHPFLASVHGIYA